ncbi:hypothetical protein SDC9_198765 [bioreactor metagenome]|uniref:Uncharacterized protein n=1 Tax=bioreactor metagenome TaxID=1076179 RepID=A0A645IVB8_9ZZZZ
MNSSMPFNSPAEPPPGKRTFPPAWESPFAARTAPNSKKSIHGRTPRSTKQRAKERTVFIFRAEKATWNAAAPRSASAAPKRCNCVRCWNTWTPGSCFTRLRTILKSTISAPVSSSPCAAFPKGRKITRTIFFLRYFRRTFPHCANP